MTADLTTTERIRHQNDAFRQHPEMAVPYGIKGEIVMTQGIAALETNPPDAIAILVRTYDDFTEDNDPHGEHDFGAFEFEGEKIFWKIDYYAPDMMHGSEDPADPTKTVRVLTIMLASEY